MYTIIDSWRISAEVADILAFYGIATDQTVVPVGEKSRYKVEIKNPTDNDKAKSLFPLRKWEFTMAETFTAVVRAFRPENFNMEAYKKLWEELDRYSQYGQNSH